MLHSPDKDLLLINRDKEGERECWMGGAVGGGGDGGFGRVEVGPFL